MDKKKHNIILYIFAFIGFFFTLGHIFSFIRKDAPLNYNPRHAKNGIDTVFTNDSVYTIDVQIKDIKQQKEEEENNYRDY